MPGSEKQNSMFKKADGFTLNFGHPMPVTSCGRRRNDGSPLEKRITSLEKLQKVKVVTLEQSKKALG